MIDGMARRAVMGPLLVCALVVGVVGPAVAQGTDADADAERIARLRDQAPPASQASADAPKPAAEQADAGVDVAASAGEQEADQASGSEEAQKPLPPNENLPLGAGGGGLFDASSDGESATGALGDGWLMSTLAALGVVLALVFGIRWVLRRGGVVTTSAPRGSVVEVLSRTTVAPRSHVVLMRVGQRILVVNDSTHGMRTLATVEAPEEVAELLASVDASKPTSISKSFGGVMSRLSGNYSEAEEALDGQDALDSIDDGVSLDRTRGAVSSVRGRLAALAGGGMKA